MKHLPNELLYLLKVYNYIMFEIGIDSARSHSDEIRDYIAKADFLDAYPTVREYLSEDKSMEDIITYIRRNEKTYALLSEWKDGEISSLFKSRGIDGSFSFTGSFDLNIDSFGSAYFVLPYKPCIQHKIVLLDADTEGHIHVDNILWFEFYKTKEALCIEIFGDNCETTKITFSDFECQKLFSSGTSLTESSISSFDRVTRLSSFIGEKHEYDPSLLNDKERSLLPAVRFFINADRPDSDTAANSVISLLNEYKLEKAVKILESIKLSDSEKKKAALSKKLLRFLKSKKCNPFIEKVLSELIDSQKNPDDCL